MVRLSVCEDINPVSAGGAGGEMPDFFLSCGVSVPEGLVCVVGKRVAIFKWGGCSLRPPQSIKH